MDIEMVATVGQSRQEAIEVTDHDHLNGDEPTIAWTKFVER